ncbi:glycoside hydrolase family 2 protein [Kribbella italica]|uniref:beta-mannosidase n=1 Tax=Kribbella italica TaxID=1540520 RepID=A0A7W9J517_9ACTN|nr:glycoside hydrolase family 2 protein [Kribbella italica]MBB5835762.1 beta-mannosidase [Kribbella italica]
MTRLSLHAEWTLHPIAGPLPTGLPSAVPATVPGTVHTDLLAAGLIPDPYLDRNEHDLLWIGESDFAYRRTVQIDALGPDERLDLVAEGLDTFATVLVNGRRAGAFRNQHRSYRIDLRSLVHPGANEVGIEFASALRSAREAEARLGARPYVGNALPYNAVRKMACNFGWDWGPVVVTAGIWRPLWLHRWSGARIAEVLPQVTVDAEGNGVVRCRVELERTDHARVELRVRVVGQDPGTGQTSLGSAHAETSLTVTTTDAEVRLDVPDVELWWPRGHGAQPLYQLEVDLLRDGERLDSWSRSIGFRTVEVRVEPDEFGTCWEFVVNGRRIFVKGANWIPGDCFLPRFGRPQYQARIQDAIDAGFNLLRVWGGGIYEDDDFYDLCNREGLLVWQDFPFACAAYAEAPELWSEVEAEARENVVRLAPNPSLVVWNGSNENIEGFYHWGWRERLGPDTDWGLGYYEKLLPGLLAELDPGRAYLPSSPWSPGRPDDPRNPDHGPVHSWEVWNRQDYRAYRDDTPRFVAEFGFQGPPNWATLTEAVHDQPLRPDSPGVVSHQKADDGNGKLLRGLGDHLPVPDLMEHWHFATQLNQARAITYGVEHFRSHAPRTSGYVIWQLNDCWPVTSWSAVDSAGRRKPLWYALRALNAERLLSFQPRPDGLSLIVSNDTAEEWAARLRLWRAGFDGTTQEDQYVDVVVPAFGSRTVLLDNLLTKVERPESALLLASADGVRRALWYFGEDPGLDLREPVLEVAVRPTPAGVVLEVTAGTFVKDLVVNADRLHPGARVDDNLITLLPGERHSFVLTLPDAVRLPPRDRWDPFALLTANHLIQAQLNR